MGNSDARSCFSRNIFACQFPVITRMPCEIGPLVLHCFVDEMEVNCENSLTLLALDHHRKKRKARYLKKYWVRDIFALRKIKGKYYNLVRDMRLHDHKFFYKMFRMSTQQLEALTKLVAPYILKDDARRETIPPQDRLCVTLRYLASGNSHATLAAYYRHSQTSISRIIPETCEALWQVLQGTAFIKCHKVRKNEKE